MTWLSAAKVDALGVRDHVRRGVGVLHPLDAAVDDDRVGIVVELEERRDRRNPLADVAIEHDPGITLDQPGQQDVRLGVSHRERHAVDDAADGDAVHAVVAVELLVGVCLEVKLGILGTDDRVGRCRFPEVDPGLLELELVDTGVGYVAGQELGLPVAGRGRHRRGHHAIAVGERQGPVLPGRLGQLFDVDLTDADHHLLGLAVHQVPVDVDVLEVVVGT